MKFFSFSFSFSSNIITVCNNNVFKNLLSRSIVNPHIPICHLQQLIMLSFNHEGKFMSMLLPIVITFING